MSASERSHSSHRRSHRRLLQKRLMVLASMFAGTLSAFAVTAPFLEPSDVATTQAALIVVAAAQVVIFVMYRNALLRHRTARSMMRGYVLSLIGTLVFVLMLLTILSGGLMVPGE